MCEVFDEGLRIAREQHVPVLFHVEEITQPQGHYTSGSHERYKSQDRLAWEKEWDGLRKMREWIIENALSDEEEIEEIERSAKKEVKTSRDDAWERYITPIKEQVTKTVDLLNNLAANVPGKELHLKKLATQLSANREPLRRDVMKTLHEAIGAAGNSDAAFWTRDYYNDLLAQNKKLYN